MKWGWIVYRMHLVAAAAAAAAVAGLSACVSVPPAPINAANSADRIAARTLRDPGVTEALTRAGMDAATQEAWSLDALTLAAWTLRSDVALARADVAAGRAVERIARQRPNPTLSLGPGNLFDNANNNTSPWTMSTAVSFTVETGGKRRIRSAQARLAMKSLHWQLAESMWQARSEVRNALFGREIAQRALALAEEEVALREAYRNWVETNIRFGALAQPERLAAQTNLVQAQAALRAARGDLAAAHTGLAASLGIAAENLPAKISAPALDELPDPGTTPVRTWRGWAVTNRLTVQHALAEYEVAEQDLRLAVARQYPDINLGSGYTFDKGDQLYTLSVGLTVPLFHTERAQIDQAIAMRERAARQFESVQEHALAEVETALERYRAAYSALTESRVAESAITNTLETVQRRLAMGSADRGELLAAQIAEVVGKRATLEALRSAINALDALEASVQRPVWPESKLTVDDEGAHVAQ